MRLAVLDVGSNSVHLLVMDAHRGAHPLPATSRKIELQLARHLQDDGTVARAGADALVRFVAECLEIAEDQGAQEVLAFATSALREASNSAAVLERVHAETGVDLLVLPGRAEAELTFLAVRRWFGWSAGELLVLDIGGGSLELARGSDELPDVAVSMPLGAGRLARDRLPGDPPAPADVRAARKHVRAEVARVVPQLTRSGRPDLVVGTSKTLRSLARVCGAAPSSEGPYVARVLRRDALAQALPRLTGLTTAQRAALPGVSPQRASQLVAGALVADAALDLLGVDELLLSPWALREGVLLRRIDAISADELPV
jgi:exopolyphosphatase/guanosine-5'-triphosphate,3'-diphosphate pyrophosphatase